MKSWRSVKVTARGQSNEEVEVSQSYSKRSVLSRVGGIKVTGSGQSNEELEANQRNR